MALALHTALTSIDEEDEVSSDLKAIIDLDRQNQWENDSHYSRQKAHANEGWEYSGIILVSNFFTRILPQVLGYTGMP